MPQAFSEATVSQLHQDQNRFIWIGTSLGLLRFDGLDFTSFPLEPDSAIKVTALFSDSKNTLWAGFKNGHIGRLENGSLVRFNPQEGLPAEAITGFAEDKKGALWFSTYGEGLYVYQNNRLYNFNSSDDGLPDDFVYTLKADEHGNIWAGTDGGIAICSFTGGKKNVEIIDARHGLPDNIVTDLAPAADGSFWVGTQSRGVCRFNPKTKSFSAISSDWNLGPVTNILALNDQVWAGTANQGVVEVSVGGKSPFTISKTASDVPTRINTLLRDHEGNIWLGGNSSAIFQTNLTFTFVAGNGNGVAQNIQAVLQSRKGAVWYSTGKAVYSQQPGFTFANTPQNRSAGTALSGANVISLYEDLNGNIWLGTFDKGLFILNPETGNLSQFTEVNGLANNNVLSIAGHGNQVWLATLGGVSECLIPDKKNRDITSIQFRNYTSQHGLGSNYIYQVFADSKKRVWFATDGKGVTMWEAGKFRNFSLQEGLRSNVVYSITESHSGQIFISTANTGIYRFTGNGFTAAAPKNGLRDLNISSIIADQHNNLLVISKQGIDVYNLGSGAVYHHGREVGISGIDPHLNAYSANSETGIIWIGSQNGLIRYSPGESMMPLWPETRINNMQVFLNELSDITGNKLAHDQNHISFNYHAFWYHHPEEVTYQVKLQGYDREWVNSRNRFITYPNLPPGEYTFKVKSSATGYFYGAPEVNHSFTIAAPFYKSVWFFLFMAIGAGGLLFSIIKYRESKLREAEQQKKQQIEFQFQTLKSQVNPHFLFNSFNTLIAVIEEDTDSAVEYVEKLSDFYRNVLLHREEDLISLREELDMLGTYYFLQTKRYKNNFILKIDVPEPLLNWQLPPLTVQLLVENAVKHNIVSRDKPLTVTITANTITSYLQVCNNLQIKSQHEPSTGTGLQNITGRYRLLTRKPVEIEKTSDYYCVKLPLLLSPDL